MSVEESMDDGERDITCVGGSTYLTNCQPDTLYYVALSFITLLLLWLVGDCLHINLSMDGR